MAVLNDCKYGCSIDEHSMALTLLKSSTHPNPEADQCEHVFTYSLMPHMGRLARGRRGAAGVWPEYADGPRARQAARATCVRPADEFAVDAPGVLVEAVKRQLDGGEHDSAHVRVLRARALRPRSGWACRPSAHT